MDELIGKKNSNVFSIDNTSVGNWKIKYNSTTKAIELYTPNNTLNQSVPINDIVSQEERINAVETYVSDLQTTYTIVRD